MQHLAPELTGAAARIVDEAVDRAIAACLKGTGVEADPLVKRRLALPVRFRGGGCAARSM